MLSFNSPLTPTKFKIPPNKHKTIKIATKVPPKIVVITEKIIISTGNFLLLADIAAADITIKINERKTPPQPKVIIIEAPSASKAVPNSPKNKVINPSKTAIIDETN
ncbi:MAG: hypothetical protein ACOCRX_09100 [Candidatus Woesearchaeota archaeon]